ncbi:MAG: sulfite exporter TauE/SafE family protein, partial [Negativicutes bacterium]|nr:sulfite exporter TauE/SafE family protein [Negativicutes bacterium]
MIYHHLVLIKILYRRRIFIFSVISLFTLGVFVGGLGTLVGIGGGLILIPIFIFLFNFSPQNAVATSLVVVFLNALSGTFAYIRQDKVFYKAGLPFALATIPGAFIGSYLTEYFTGESFRLAFGIFILLIATIMLFNTNPPSNHLPFHKKTFQFNQKLG